MYSKQEDENYWNRSDFKPFSFDDEELTTNKSRIFGNALSSSFVADIIFEGVPKLQKQETEKRPLESIISKHSLNKIFGDNIQTSSNELSMEEELKILKRQIINQWNPKNVSMSVKLILTGRQYSLHLYRSLDVKKELLDEAIISGDGNAILAVVLYLSKTLKKTLFYQLLQTRPVAVAQYVQYLTIRLMVSELIDLLEMLGQTRDAAMKQLTFIIQGTQNQDLKLHKLNTCYNNHFSLPDSKDKQFVQNYIQYLQWLASFELQDKTVLGNSVLCSLAYLCKNHWNEQKTSKYSPWFLSSQQNVTERQVQWTILSSRAGTQQWEDIETSFLTKGWIGGKKLKSIIPVEKIIIELSRNDAPYRILCQFLEVVSNLEKRLEYAKQLPCHRAVIDVLVLMKDRQGIVDYKFNLKPRSEEFLYAENALRSQIKWKN